MRCHFARASGQPTPCIAHTCCPPPPLPPARSWAKALCTRHGAAIQASGAGASSALPALRSLQKALTRLHEDLAATCEGNMYTLEYLCSAAQAGQEGDAAEEQAPAAAVRSPERRANGDAAAAGGGSSSEGEDEEDDEGSDDE